MKKTNNKFSDKQHILLTSLGTRVFGNTTYKWKDAEATADLAPLALMELFGNLNLSIPNRFIAVVTEGAKDTTWPVFRDWVFSNHRIEAESIPIDDGRNSDEIRKILQSVADPQYIPEGAELTLDVTQGFRHFPFIFYALVLYLKSLRGVNIRGVYYGMAEGIPQDAPKPIIDLQPLLELPEWFYAVRMFRDQGTTMPMAQLLQPLADTLKNETGQLFKSGDREAGQRLSTHTRQIKKSVNRLTNYAFAYESALPLELGKASKELIEASKELIDSIHRSTIDSVGLPPLFAELNGAIVTAAEKSAFGKRPNRGNWKPNVVLDADELERQARMIDIYLDRDQLSLGVGLMREWVVSWAIWKSGNNTDIKNWVDHQKVRWRYKDRLGAIAAFSKNDAFKSIITPEKLAFGNFWHQLGDALRNFLHHHAMRVDAFEKTPKSLQGVRTFWNDLRRGKTELPPLGGSRGKLLISPQGTRPGVLFSALKVTHPADTIVICSSASVSSIADAASHASFAGKTESIKLDDPHGGFDEIVKAVDQVRHYLLEADEVVANMTGGTTLMGIIVQQLVEEAQKLDRPVRRFVLIDRRPPEQQDQDPFVVGGCHWLDN